MASGSFARVGAPAVFQKRHSFDFQKAFWASEFITCCLINYAVGQYPRCNDWKWLLNPSITTDEDVHFDDPAMQFMTKIDLILATTNKY